MSAQQKQEKKIMDEKIAKVREVVRNFSTTQIVLVLHYYDLDVEKTIQSFVHGTYREALGDWEQTGHASSKNKAGKKKSKAAKAGGENGSTTSGKSTPAAAPKSANSDNNGYANHTAASFAAPAAAPTAAVNGVVRKDDLSAPSPTSQQTPQQNGGGQPSSGSSKKKNKFKQTGISAAVSADDLARFQALDDAAKLSAIAEEASQLNNYATELDELEKIFDSQISHTQTNIMQCFLEIKQRLSARERQLCAELTRGRDEGLALFNTRRMKLIDLSGKAITPPKAAKEREVLYKELKGFNAAKAQDQSIARATRFHADNTSIYDVVSQFGEVILANNVVAESAKPVAANGTTPVTTPAPAPAPPVSAAAANGKKANQPAAQPQVNGHANGAEKAVPLSRASVVSDVSSDLSQISPNITEKKVTQQVSSSGIIMQSDGLSADEMAKLHQQIEATLRAQGIDPAVLSEIGMNMMAPRKRPQQKNAGGNEKRGGGGKGGNGGAGNNSNNKSHQQAQSKLSALS